MSKHLQTLFQHALKTHNGSESSFTNEIFNNFFIHSYPESMGGIQESLFNETLVKLNTINEPYDRQGFICDILITLGESKIHRSNHPFSVLTQEKDNITSAFQSIDSLCKAAYPDSGLAGYLICDTLSRGMQYWWTNLIIGMGANPSEKHEHGKETDYLLSFVGMKFGQAIREMCKTDTDEKPKENEYQFLTSGIQKRLVHLFKRVDHNFFSEPAFWNSCVPHLPNHPIMLGLSLKTHATKPSAQNKNVEEWLSRFLKLPDYSYAKLIQNIVEHSGALSAEQFSDLYKSYPSLLQIIRKGLTCELTTLTKHLKNHQEKIAILEHSVLLTLRDGNKNTPINHAHRTL